MSQQYQDRPGEVVTEAVQEPESRATEQDTSGGYPSPVFNGGIDDDRGVYRRAASTYRNAGWFAPLPLPPAAKFPPPRGFTGYDGVWPDDEQISEWMSTEPAESNLMLRVNYGIIAIDVDAYDTKTGGQTLEEAENRWGPLPPTYRSSARLEDNVSGQRVYRVPDGLFFRSVIRFPELHIGDIEIVQPHHRYITAYPSIHPKTTQQYRWYAPNGSLLREGMVPHVGDLPELPSGWVDALSRDAVRESVFDGSGPNRSPADRERINEELYNHLIATQGDGAPDSSVSARLERALTGLTEGSGSRYDTTRDHVAALIRMKALGRVGVPEALGQLMCAYILEVGDSRPGVVAESEFLRFTQGAAALVAATMPNYEQDSACPRDYADGESAPPDERVEDRPSWGRVDLGPLLSGDQGAPVPTLFPRSDGVCLFYPGLVHSVHGESESGKSLILQLESVRLVNLGKDVLYVDCESDPRSVLGRLVEFGATPEAISEHFHYVQPEATPNSPGERAAWESLLAGRYELAVIDGVTDALGLFGYATKDNDDVTRWTREVPKVIASRTEAAVVLIDHVVKDPGARGRWAIGGQAKMAALTGAAYTVEVDKPLGRGLRGVVILRVGKDRPGEVRGRCGSFRKGDRTQEAARVIVDSTSSSPEVTVEAPLNSGAQALEGPAQFRPTNLMERASALIKARPGELTKNQAAVQVGGKKQSTLLAIDVLEAEGFVITKTGRSGYPVYESVKVYRETEDERSDRYLAVGNLPLAMPVVPGSRFPNRGTGEPLQTSSTEPLGTIRNPSGHWPPSDNSEQPQRDVRPPWLRGLEDLIGSQELDGTDENHRASYPTGTQGAHGTCGS